MNMHFMDKFVEIVFVPCTKVDESLHRLVRICRDILPLASFYNTDGVVDKHSEVSDTIVDVGGLVDSHKGLIEDSEEVTEELESSGLV